jgi:hypothetical protein
MNAFSQWLSRTDVSLFSQQQFEFLAFLQAIHIMAVAMVGSSVLMIDLQIWVWSGVLR